MNKNVKIFAIAFSFALGLGSADVFSIPNTQGCIDLREACQEGDQNACTLYDGVCGICEVNPDLCNMVCDVNNPNDCWVAG